MQENPCDQGRPANFSCQREEIESVERDGRLLLLPSVNRGSVSFFESFEFFEMEFYILYFMLVDGMKGFFFRIVNLRR